VRILLSATPAHGHILPLLPLARAFREQGDQVALVTSGSLAAAFPGEGIEVLPAGPDLMALMGEVIARTGADPLKGLTPDQEAEAFAGARIDLTVDEALTQAGSWKPDLIVSEHYDFVGPLVGALLGIPVVALAFGPAMSAESAALMAEKAGKRWSDRGVVLQEPARFLDTCPPSLQIDGVATPQGHMGLRPEPHRAPGGSLPQLPAGHEDAMRDSRVLVTFGTIFSSPAVLSPVLTELAAEDWDVHATAGLAASVEDYVVDAGRVTVHSFTPLADLLADVDVVVTHGGAGSTLGTLAAGVPLVIVPLGADHFVQADRVTAAGAGLAVTSGADAAEIARAVAEIMSSPSYGENARRIAAEIAALPSPAEVATRLKAEILG
jgi:UDP:flavonoid glycosyltransferase YjiC (YdhE family)